MDRPPPQPWHADPEEVDRFLDGEVGPEERLAREADALRDPGLQALLGARRAFLAAVRAAAAARPGFGPGAVEALRRRVERALERTPRATVLRPWAWASAAAAVLVLAFGLTQLSREADATPPYVRLARQQLRSAAPSTGPTSLEACGNDVRTSPFSFPPVEWRELKVQACRDNGGQGLPTAAVLYRPEDLEVVGFVAVPDPGAPPSEDIGVTRLEDTVVFDVRQGGAVIYVAVDRTFVDRQGSCRACHGTVRSVEPNPHRLLERRLP